MLKQKLVLGLNINIVYTRSDNLVDYEFVMKATNKAKNLHYIYLIAMFVIGSAILDSIFDIFALRVVLGKLDHVTEQELIGKCYEVLGVIHRELVPIPHRFKDYIANPKPNGYMSLHTTVLGLGTDDFKKPVEIQIRPLILFTRKQTINIWKKCNGSNRLLLCKKN